MRGLRGARRSLLLAREGQSPRCSPKLRAQTVEKYKASLSPPFRPFRSTRRSNLPPFFSSSRPRFSIPTSLVTSLRTSVDLGVASKAMEKQMSRRRKRELGNTIPSPLYSFLYPISLGGFCSAIVIFGERSFRFAGRTAGRSRFNTLTVDHCST